MESYELKVLCDLLMVSDPWPLPDADMRILEDFATRESQAQGYDSWVVAYHKIGPTAQYDLEQHGQFGVGA